MTEDEMVGWHHRLDGHEFEQAPGVGDGQGSLGCCSPWGRKEPDMTALQKGEASHSSILAWRIPWTEKPGRLLHGVAKSWIRPSNFHFHF